MAKKKAVTPRRKKEVVSNGLTEAILGFNPQSMGVQLSQVDTLFKNNRWYLLSNMRQVLSEMYVEHGLVQTIVDVPVDDGLRGGVEIKTKQLDEDEIEQLSTFMEREDDLGVMAEALKWNRLFGGAGVIIITDQDPRTPLNMDAIDKNSKVEFRAVDMWELFYSRQNTDYGTAIDGSEFDNVEYYDYYGVQLHHTRVMKMNGLKAPSFVRPRLRGWGFSIIESLVRSLNQYFKSTDLVFEVLDEFKIDVYKIKNLTNTLVQSGGTQKIQQRIQLANQQKNYQHAIVMDSEDDHSAKELSFGGIAETMAGIRMQIASDMRMPLTKIFGISSAGFSSGEDDIENYNAMVESQVRQKSKFDILRMIEIRCRQKFGYVPDDLKINFKPLRMLSAEQEENVKTQKFSRVLQAKQAGELNSLEFREAVNRDNLLPIKLDTSQVVLGELEEEKEAVKTPPTAPKSTTTAPDAPIAKNSFNEPRIVVVGLVCGNEILTGRRRDNNLWTFPGGHMNEGETQIEAACRETEEEVGIKISPSMLKHISSERIKSHRTGKYFEVHAYKAELKTKIMPRSILDPDAEFDVIRWVPLKPSTPELKPESRHAKRDVVLAHFFSMKNSLEYEVAAYEVDGGDKQFDAWRERQVDRLQDKEKVKKAKEASQKAFGEIRWQFVVWHYQHQGGKI